MSYYIATTLTMKQEEAVAVVTEALKTEGFGVLTEIDVQATLKEKLGVPFRKYRILGACNPPIAHRALEVEDKIGLMLPCNVVVQESGEGEVEVSAVDPVVSMQGVGNPALAVAAAEIREKLVRVIESLEP